MHTKKFDTPVIFGALCDRSLDLPAGLARALKSRIPAAVLLPFKVEKRHLKNVVTCMRLMDVMGLVVLGSHRRSIVAHLKHLDGSAKKAGAVDVIVRRSNSFKHIPSLCKGGLGRVDPPPPAPPYPSTLLRANKGGEAGRPPRHDFVGLNSEALGISPVDLLTALMCKNTQKA